MPLAREPPCDAPATSCARSLSTVSHVPHRSCPQSSRVPQSSSLGRRPSSGPYCRRPMPELPVLDYDSVLDAVSPRGGDRARARGAAAPPRRRVGDAGEGLPRRARRSATSARCPPAATASRCSSGSPRSRATPRDGLPTVTGVICLSDASNGEPLMLLDARSVTALRTGAVAAVAARALAREKARTVGIIGCGLHGAWTARCLAAAGYGPGVCYDPRVAGGAGARGRARLGRRLARAGAPLATSSAASPRAPRSSSTPATCDPGCT